MTTRETLQELYETLAALAPKTWGKVDHYSRLALRLAKIVRHEPWTWRYVQGVLSGTIKPSPEFERAVMLLASELDGQPPEIASSDIVTVYAPKGNVKAESLVLGKSRECEDPTCTLWFVPVVPWQKYCPRHRRKR